MDTATLSSAWRTIIEPRLPAIRQNLSSLAPSAPQPTDVFAALMACPDPAEVRVIILGQDPYPTAGNADGLAFSCKGRIPASLKNIYKELASDLQCPPPQTGCLRRWAEQGVLLLNDVLTVTIGKPGSHAGRGWEELTAELIAAVLQSAPHVVLVAWGRNAQKKLENVVIKSLLSGHTVLRSPHPSPLSAYTGFFGSRPFSQTNTALTAHGLAEIQWAW